MEVSHEQYVTTFNSLPPLVRSYIIDGEIAPVVTDLGKKYSFHVDLIGMLEERATHMLMGLISPTELLGELVLAGVNGDVAKSVLDELNTRIFMPLQKRMHEAPGGEPSTEPVAAPVPPPVSSAIPPAPPPRPETTYEPLPVPAVHAAPQEPQVPAPVPAARTMETDMRAAQAEPLPITPRPSPVIEEPPPRANPVGQIHPDTPLTKEYGADPYREPIG